MRPFVAPCLLPIALAACPSAKVDIGDNKPALSAAPPTLSQAVIDAGQGDDAGPLENFQDFVGVWEGYVEAFTWDDGSDRVRLTLDAYGHGSFEVGEAPALPLPPIAANSWPPGWNGSGNPQSGVRYPVAAVMVQDRRVQLAINFGVLVGEWCSLQTPLLQNPNALPMSQVYGCFPPDVGALIQNGPSGTPTDCHFRTNAGVGAAFPCSKLACMRTCRCTATGCTSGGFDGVQLDATLGSDSRELLGTLLVADRLTLHMTRQP